jgi:hypothetical protein
MSEYEIKFISKGGQEISHCYAHAKTKKEAREWVKNNYIALFDYDKLKIIDVTEKIIKYRNTSRISLTQSNNGDYKMKNKLTESKALICIQTVLTASNNDLRNYDTMLKIAEKINKICVDIVENFKGPEREILCDSGSNAFRARVLARCFKKMGIGNGKGNDLIDIWSMIFTAETMGIDVIDIIQKTFYEEK